MRYINHTIAVLLLLSCSELAAQVTGPASLPTLPTSDALQRSLDQMDPEAIITDGAIDPKEYRLGPGDLLQLRVWTTPEPYIMMVTMDQKVVVPRIGEFDARKKTLAQLHEELQTRVTEVFTRQSSKDQQISLSLVQPRRTLVTVKGQVETPGVIPLTSATRAVLAIELANQKKPDNLVFADQARLREFDRRNREIERLRPFLGTSGESKSSERYITVTHSDGTTDRIDMLRYNATRDPRFCPLLREGDLIYVPFKREVEGMVAIYGAVRAPGEYEFVESDSLVSMIQNAFGSTPNADLARVEVTRMTLKGDEFLTSVYDVTNVTAGSSADIPLQRGDRIFIRERSDVRELSRVIVRGEVARPGVYPITRLNTTLSQIIDAAGGLTDFAHLNGAYISRRLESEIDDITPEEEAERLWRLANLDVEDTVNFRLQTQVRSGDVKVDMTRLLKYGDKSADVTLRDGDVIVVPTAPNSVYVWGYIGKMGFVPFVPGAELSHYINASGGYAEGSVPSETRIIKARTRQYLEPDDTEIEAGDEIYVPKVGDYPEDYSLRFWSSVIGIVAGTLGVVLTAITISRFNN